MKNREMRTWRLFPVLVKGKRVLKRSIDPSPDRALNEVKRNQREVSVMDAIQVLGHLIKMLGDILRLR